MSKKFYRFYGGFLSAQEKWLNKMADKGFRLIGSGKLLYEFDTCQPKQYQYRIDFVGQKSKEGTADYRTFLEDMGYRIFYKNINLNYSMGKVRFRPWAEKGGRIAAKATTYNRELLIVEKENDGTPFELHTSYADKVDYYCNLRNPWLCLFLIFGLLGIMNNALLFGSFSLLALIPTILYQVQVQQMKREMKHYE